MQGKTAPSSPLFPAAWLCALGAWGACSFSLPGPTTQANAMPSTQPAPQATMAQLPVVFERNVGQTNEPASFIARGPGYTLALNGSQTRLALRAGTGTTPRTRRTASVLTLSLLGANPSATTAGEKPVPAKVNYFIGNDPSNWRTDVPVYEQVRAIGVYPGIDLVHHASNQGELEYDFVVAPRVDPGQIALAIDGAEKIGLASNGDLLLKTAGGELRQQKPVCYQVRDGVRMPVEGEFVLTGHGDGSQVGFRLGAYDSRRPLVIDPVLQYSTYLGGGGDDVAVATASRNDFETFVTGYTRSVNFPTQEQFQSDPGDNNYDAFVTVLDTTQTGAASLLYSTYLGGGGDDQGYGIATNGTGVVFITGKTGSTDFPLKGEIQQDQGGFDAFVVRLDTRASGASSLQYSTYLGGDGYDEGRGIAWNFAGPFSRTAGDVCITGTTQSVNFPIWHQLQTYQGGADCFAAGIDTDDTGTGAVDFSTYLGGAGDDFGVGVGVDGQRRAYVTGDTLSTNFPLAGQFQTDQPGRDAFFSLLDLDPTHANPAGLAYSTYLGGAGDDAARGVAASEPVAYVTGWTGSANFPTSNAFQPDQPGIDAFVTGLEISKTGAASLRYSTYLGGAGTDRAYGITYLTSNGLGITGGTDSDNFPVKNGVQGNQPAVDGFLVLLQPEIAGNAGLSYSTYLGGGQDDEGISVTTNSTGKFFVAGYTKSVDFPVKRQLQSGSAANGSDAFVSVVDLNVGGTLEAPALVNFGAVKRGKEKQVLVELRNTHPSQILNVAVGTPTKGFTALESGGEFGIPPGGTVNVTVTFKGKKKGTKRGTLPLTTSDPAHPTFEIALKARTR